MMDYILRLTGKQFDAVQRHLFPGDGLEAVSLLLCGRRSGATRHCLSVMKVVHVPYEECERRRDRITWKTASLVPLLQEADKSGLGIVKVHSHPSGYGDFSEFDDVADRELSATCSGWANSEDPHGSVVMLPDGRVFGRVLMPDGEFETIDQISVAGERIRYFFAADGSVEDFADRHAQAFGPGTTGILSQLKAGLIGCSGTGSPTGEQLNRLGFREVVCIDPEPVEIPNLNRILNSTRAHAESGVAKVAVMAKAFADSALGTICTEHAKDLVTPEMVTTAAECDVLFGCIDSAFARHVLNKIASTYNIPYVDVGVRLVADGKGGVEHITGGVHYLQPDGSSLLSRGVYTMADVQAEALRRTDPEEYERRIGEGYISGSHVTRPAVIPVNMIFSGLVVLEFLSRIHNLREADADNFASQRISLIEWFNDASDDGERCPTVTRFAGRGDMTPLLGMPELSVLVRKHA